MSPARIVRYRINSNDEILEVEDAIRHLGLFELAATPQLTHGICQECFDFMESVLEAAS